MAEGQSKPRSPWTSAWLSQRARAAFWVDVGLPRRPGPQPEACRACGLLTHAWGARAATSAWAPRTGYAAIWRRCDTAHLVCHNCQAAGVTWQSGRDAHDQAHGEDDEETIEVAAEGGSTTHKAPTLRSCGVHLFQFAIEHWRSWALLNDPARMQGLRESLMACTICLRLGSLTSAIKRWVRYATDQRYPVKRPTPLQVAEFLKHVRSSGPTAAASMFQALRWFQQNMGTSFH